MKASSVLGTLFFSVVIQAAGIGTGLLSSHVLGPEGKGELTTVIVWAATVLYIGTFGLSEATAYFAAKHRARLPTVFATSQALAVGLGAVLTGGGWLLVSKVLAGRGPLLDTTRWFLLWYAVPGFVSLCAVALLQGAGRWRWFNICRTAVHVVTLAAMLMLWKSGAVTVAAFCGAYLLGNAAPPLLALLAIGLAGDWSWRPSWATAREMFGYGLKVQSVRGRESPTRGSISFRCRCSFPPPCSGSTLWRPPTWLP